MPMTGNLLARYTWLVDTLRRAGRLTRTEINRRWMESDFSSGSPMPRRTFYNYRVAVFDLFGVEILYDAATREYYIDSDDAVSDINSSSSVTDWLLNSAAMSGMLADARSISSRIFLEQVPSARVNLSPIISAIKENRVLKFSYLPFTRSLTTEGIIFEPYLLKLFRQRWYVAGRNVAENRIKTYALDRMSLPEATGATFEMPSDFDAQEYFKYSFGIVVDSSRPRRIALRADSKQAKYLRALPLHSSQTEMIHDEFSIFNYEMLITPDLVTEIMSMGPSVTVLAPQELRAMLATRLRETLTPYEE
ncbi:MAG: WYL domain-containing protein [Bacteroidales bacterium]|nr:WYL domain-containing protein [Bacteroidales bacterium]